MATKKSMTNKKTATNSTGTTTATAGDKKMDLGAVRAKFDGFKDVAAKLPNGKQKNAILTGIEDLYFWTASALKGMVTPSVSEA